MLNKTSQTILSIVCLQLDYMYRTTNYLQSKKAKV